MCEERLILLIIKISSILDGFDIDINLAKVMM